MAKTGRVALAQTVFHNKKSLVLIRSVKRVGASFPVFQRRDPGLRRDSERRRRQAPRRAGSLA